MTTAATCDQASDLRHAGENQVLKATARMALHAGPRDIVTHKEVLPCHPHARYLMSGLAFKAQSGRIRDNAYPVVVPDDELPRIVRRLHRLLWVDMCMSCSVVNQVANLDEKAATRLISPSPLSKRVTSHTSTLTKDITTLIHEWETHESRDMARGLLYVLNSFGQHTSPLVICRL
jgi:hypothetical protein